METAKDYELAILSEIAKELISDGYSPKIIKTPIHAALAGDTDDDKNVLTQKQFAIIIYGGSIKLYDLGRCVLEHKLINPNAIEKTVEQFKILVNRSQSGRAQKTDQPQVS